MKLTHTLLSLATFVAVVNVPSSYADNTGIVFPPTDNSRIYQYPPQMPNTITRPSAPTYTFGQANNRLANIPPAPMMAPQANMMPPANMGRIPRQANQYPMPRRNYPRAPYGGNRNSTPFGNNMPFSNNMPFGNNRGNNFNPFSGGNMPFSGNSFNNPMNNMFGNNNNRSMPFFGNSNNKNRKKAWGDKRNIWPDFYTDFTDDAWDNVTSGPRDLGRMPGGWRFPHISTPDPVTVSDAITNQFPPIAEEAGNMMDFSDWGVFD